VALGGALLACLAVAAARAQAPAQVERMRASHAEPATAQREADLSALQRAIAVLPQQSLRQRGTPDAPALSTTAPPEVAGKPSAQPAPALPPGLEEDLIVGAAAPNAGLPALKRGELRQIQLNPQTERLAERMLDAQLRASGVRVGGSAIDLETFPNLMLQLDTQQRELTLKPYALSASPLTYRPESRTFVGTVRVGVSDVIDPSVGRALSVPLVFEMAESDIAQPAQVQLTRTSPPNGEFRISVAQPEQPHSVRVLHAFDPTGVELKLRVKPTLFVRADRQQVQGYGLETTRIQVIGYGMPQGRPVKVDLSTDGSVYFAQSTLTLDADGRASTQLRTDRTGPLAVSAAAPGFDSVPTTLHVTWPWRPLIVSLAGALLGGLLRLLPGANRGTNRRWWLALAVAMGAGVLVFLLAAIGVNLLPLAFPEQAGYAFVFVVSALGAWLGVHVLPKLPGQAGG
jgi:hypothetical protein